MSDWRDRLTNTLEPTLRHQDPRPQISPYHDMPFAIFRYPADDEWAVRSELALLCTRLEMANKRVTVISLAECLQAALDEVGIGTDTLVSAERDLGLGVAIETVHGVLSDHAPLDRMVVARVPADAEPTRDVLLLARAGALFPFYRTSALLEQMMGRIEVPTVLMYPGDLEEPAGLRFMGVLPAEHAYRPRIF